MPLNVSEITEVFSSKVIAEASRYVSSVLDLSTEVDQETHDEIITGLVIGAGRDIYYPEVTISRDGKYKVVDTWCTCPSEYRCVHSATVLLASAERQEAQTPGGSGHHVRPEVVRWLESFRESAVGEAKRSRPTVSQALAYQLSVASYSKKLQITLHKGTLSKDGKLKSVRETWGNVEKSLAKPPQFVTPEDLEILRLLWLEREQTYYGQTSSFPLTKANGSACLERILATGRLFTSERSGSAEEPCVMKQGAVREGSIKWEDRPSDFVQAVLHSEPKSSGFFFLEPIWYIDNTTRELGVLELPNNPRQAIEFLTMPALSPAEAELVASVVAEVGSEFPLPPTKGLVPSLDIDVEPVPILQLNSLANYGRGYGYFNYSRSVLDHGSYSFDYDGHIVQPGTSTSLVKASDGKTVNIKRRVDSEKKRATELRKAGLVTVAQNRLSGPEPFPAKVLGFESDGEEVWARFVATAIPVLRSQGWRVQMDDRFRHNVIDVDEVNGHLRESSDGWFDLEMGIVVGDRTVQLVPLLGDLFQHDTRWLDGSIDQIADAELIRLKIPGAETLRLKADRLKPLVRFLIDLFENLSGGSLRVSRLDAGRLQALDNTGRWQFHGDSSVRELAQKLKDGAGVSDVAIPSGLRAELRPYQHQGLNWMQFLREHSLAGVLADDMGLGKTLQTLAHVLAEKEAGRLDRPALIIMPTSLIHNWWAEAERFTPGLTVLALQGQNRKERFDQIPQCDLVLTTYALLWRDHPELAKYSYHLLILDEAQYAKNTGTAAASAIRSLKAQHRLCLTGTPLENHLGELWALYDFLLPGFLGSQKDFTKRWRTPIEKSGNTDRRDLLARRIRPFMLRRRKDDVAKELPAKTTIVQHIDLEGGQRDLYEAVRSAMQEKVRDAVAAQGLQRSHIVVLDALLKLRQVCCDPRLVKLERAAAIGESAKLDHLMTMLPQLIEEGRRVLIFSQFTGMLSLISEALTKSKIPFVILTGNTTDRATPIGRFQAGDVPVFLISLKAGGVGLNLTSADTVIHFDPWWNPAAENQATDRAHRIGQDKPVFVYKFIVAGSIEEKILTMQEQKSALAEGILSEDRGESVKFSADDLQALFAPMA